MKNYSLTQAAKSDLINIKRYTSEHWGKLHSQEYLSKLRHTISLLAETPSLGKLRTDVGSKILSFPYCSHVIYYVNHNNCVVVFAVLHQKMLPSKHLIR